MSYINGKRILKKWLVAGLFAMCFTGQVYAQIGQDSYQEKVRKYVAAYQDMAIQEQLRSGVPAAITLGQGILETEAGCSELATCANNHFGIKCKKEWKGETFAHTDDKPNECFRKYGCAGDSYKDHSDYLKTSPRYAALFKLSPTDYAAWAYGLKRCGYATSPIYAQKLIKIIEDFELQEYTYQALNANLVYKQPKPKEDKRYAAAFNAQIPASDTPVVKKLEEANEESHASLITTPATAAPALVNTKGNTDGVLKINDLKAIKAYKGDMLLQYAILYNIRYEKLLEYNDLPDAPLAEDMYLYLERKPSRGQHEKHVVKDGETMWQIAQNEPMQLQRLLNFNLLGPGEEAAVGTVLQLQHYAGSKPKLNTNPHFMKEDLVKKGAPSAGKRGDYIVKEQVITEPVTASVQKPAAYNDTYVEHPVMAAPAQQPATQETTVVVQNTPTPNTPETTQVSTPAPTQTPAETTQPTNTQAPVQNTPVPTPDAAQGANQVTIDAPAPVATTSTTPAQPEPDDELARLKAKLDKIVYAENRPVNRAAPTPAAPPVTKTEQPAAAAPVPVKKQEKKSLAAKAAVKYYTVKKGDTAFSVAKKHNMTVEELQELNGMKKVTVEIGQKLKVK